MPVGGSSKKRGSNFEMSSNKLKFNNAFNNDDVPVGGG